MADSRGQARTGTYRDSARRGKKKTGCSRFRCVLLPCVSLAVVSASCTFWQRANFYGVWGSNAGFSSIRGGESNGFRVEKPFRSQGAGPDSPVVAYAISLTSLELPKASSVLDAAEVLIRSIRNACAFSAYGCETIAFVLPNINEEGRRYVEGMGWRIIVKDLPVAVEDMKNQPYREHVVNSGCCGADEFIKLHAYTLLEFHRVVHLDVDTLVLHPLDQLMESDASLLYTTDPAMSLTGQKVFPVQGGFLLVRPDLAVYEDLQAIVRMGDWRKGHGWGDSKIGWFYGGATIQGLLPYYYNVFAKGAAIEVDRCVYNHMSDTDACCNGRFSATIPLGATSQESRERTSSAAPAAVAIRSVHFTQACPKPWLCALVPPGSSPCASLQSAWLEGRKAILADKGLPASEACNLRGKYLPIPRNRV